MTPSAFIKKWKAANLKERSTSQEHFIDLCRLLDEPTLAGVTDFFFSSCRHARDCGLAVSPT
jgi:hypothetical protein